MRNHLLSLFDSLRIWLRQILSGPQTLAFLPAIALGAYWLGGESALMIAALGLPALFALAGGFDSTFKSPQAAIDRATGLALGDTLESRLTGFFTAEKTNALKSGFFQIEIDDFTMIQDRYGQAGADELLQRIADRLRSAVRDSDLICKLGDCRFGIALSPVPQMDVEIGIQTAARLQSAVEEPISLDSTTVYVSCCIGFCLTSRSPKKNARALIDAASKALQEAMRNAPSAIRMYSEEMQRKLTTQQKFQSEAEVALENGQIQPWFQPQISTDTGRVTGFEALARWTHPERGMVSPADFLPALEGSGQLERLGEVILYHSLSALKTWDAAGVDVPRVGVNFTGDELRNPKLIDKLGWELDRFDIAPSRLSVEVLETVLSTSQNDIIARNINGLAKLGCSIDLDDFGTGHASISSIRRFAVARIKIDRSFVMKIDRDGEQQRMLAAILMMAERLGLDTLAEGVETVGEHALLAQLGCRHVQGFGIARPMPMDQTVEWIRAHNAKLKAAPQIGRQTG